MSNDSPVAFVVIPEISVVVTTRLGSRNNQSAAASSASSFAASFKMVYCSVFVGAASALLISSANWGLLYFQ